MTKNILKTKNKLSLIFTSIILSILILFSLSFFSLKYLHELSIEKSDFKRFSTDIINWKLSLEKITRKKEAFKRSENIKSKRNFFKERMHPLNYILLSKKWEIISTNVLENLNNDFLVFIKSIENKKDIQKESGFLIKSIEVNNYESLILFKKIRYDLEDYIKDIFSFSIISIVFWFIVYLLSSKLVNKVFRPVEENIKEMNNFIHNAGHELKTPISVIDSNIQIIKDIKKYDEMMLVEIKNETKKLNSLIDSLIRLSDIWELKVEKKDINIKEICQEIKNDFKNIAYEKNISIKIESREDITIKANREYFYIMLSNIVWNAIKYNKNNWKIDIKIDKTKLSIKDSWKWIPSSDLEKIFDRFYKIDKSRNSDGFGIWLSLVKKIAYIYKWKIEVKSKKWEWTEFIIKF